MGYNTHTHTSTAQTSLLSYLANLSKPKNHCVIPLENVRSGEFSSSQTQRVYLRVMIRKQLCYSLLKSSHSMDPMRHVPKRWLAVSISPCLKRWIVMFCHMQMLGKEHQHGLLVDNPFSHSVCVSGKRLRLISNLIQRV